MMITRKAFIADSRRALMRSGRNRLSSIIYSHHGIDIRIPANISGQSTNLIFNRQLSQHLSVNTKTNKATFSVHLQRVPSNYGYFSSRVNRIYNEDRYQVGILDMNLHENTIAVTEKDSENVRLRDRAYDIQEPFYNPKHIRSNFGKGLVPVFNFTVFDGHGGDECSEFVKNHLMENVESLNMNTAMIKRLFKWYVRQIGGYWRRWNKKQSLHLIQAMGMDYLLHANKKGVNNSRLQKTELINSQIDNNPIWEIDDIMTRMNGEDFLRLKVFLAFLFTDYQFLTYELYSKESKLTQKMSPNSDNTEEEAAALPNVIKSETENGQSKEKDPSAIQDLTPDSTKDSSMAASPEVHHSGSTCTSLFLYTIEPDENDHVNEYFYQPNVLSKLLVAHVGDTRAILCDSQGIAHALTVDHHPSNPMESRRLQKFSTGMMMTDSFGEERFLNFANTRSFGDVTAKNIGVSAEPEMSEYLIGSSNKLKAYKKKNEFLISQHKIRDFGGDESFLVLITDGVTNYLSDQEVCDLIMSTSNNKGALRGTPHAAAREVIEFVECIGGDDNATCQVIRLDGWGKWPMIDRTGSLREEKMMNVPRRSR